MHTFQTIKKLNQAVQVSLLGEASAYNFSVLKRPKYGPSAMPKGHSLIKYRNQYFLFTSEPPSEGQGATNPNWTKAAIWQCDRNGKRTAPLEDPLWDSKKDGWSAEDAFDSFLDYTDGDLSEAANRQAITEAATPGKPETMAQKHGRMSRFGEAMYNHKEYLAFAKQVAKDWHSGDMALNRMQSLIESDFAWLMRTNRHGINTGYVNAEHETEIRNLMKAFRKRVKSEGLEPTSRLGDGGGFVGSAMGKITPNQIGEYFDLIVNFITIDWPKIAPSTLK